MRPHYLAHPQAVAALQRAPSSHLPMSSPDRTVEDIDLELRIEATDSVDALKHAKAEPETHRSAPNIDGSLGCE